MKKSLNNPNQIILQDLLRKLRTDKGLSQTALAKRIQKPQSFVSKYESGERRLDIIELREICKAVGITLAYFIFELEKQFKD
jgi:transcriptional regulator with XRE-family HTH domain